MLETFQKLRAIHRLVDDAESWLTKQLGVPICTPSCGLCCSQNVLAIHSIEASLIISELLGAGKTRYIDAARSWLIDHHTGVDTYEGVPYGVITGKIREEWDSLSSTPCIFLQGDKTCAIYKSRPLPCRTYGVTRSASEYCPRPIGKGESYVKRMYVGGEPLDLIKNAWDLFIQETKYAHPDWIKQGFMPTMLFRQARELEFRGLIADNKIATAKLVGLDYSVQANWQSDLEVAWGRLEKPVDLIRA